MRTATGAGTRSAGAGWAREQKKGDREQHTERSDRCQKAPHQHGGRTKEVQLAACEQRRLPKTSQFFHTARNKLWRPRDGLHRVTIERKKCERRRVVKWSTTGNPILPLLPPPLFSFPPFPLPFVSSFVWSSHACTRPLRLLPVFVNTTNDNVEGVRRLRTPVRFGSLQSFSPDALPERHISCAGEALFYKSVPLPSAPLAVPQASRKGTHVELHLPYTPCRPSAPLCSSTFSPRRSR